MNFKPGQWYITGLGRRRAEIVAVDSVRVGREESEVIAYRYEGRHVVRMRSVELTEGWALEGSFVVGDVVQHRKIVGGVRVGGACEYRVTYVSDHLVCYEVFGSDGRHVSEHALSRTEFEADFEGVTP